MAKYFRRRRHSLAPFFMCLCFLVRLQVSTALNVNKSQVKSNDFDVSVQTINGQVYLKWNTSSLWQNTTVYFISNLYDKVSNTSYGVNISVCHAFKFDKDSWIIKPIKGNLLDFCNKSKHCELGRANSDSLVGATVDKRTGELSCQLFTTCTNFEDIYRVQVVSISGRQEYSFQSGNKTIYAENIPPINREINVKKWTHGGSDAVLDINYFHSSELCGFGAKPSESIQFVIKYYKTNNTNCFYMGQKTVPFGGKVTTVKFEEIIRDTEVMYFYVTGKSSTNNKTTASQRYTLETYRKDTDFSSTGGVLSISWRPQWNCFGENIIEQARYCFRDGNCVPACEASLFANGTLRATKTYDRRIINACSHQAIIHRNSCSVETLKSTPFITMSWSPETRRISCALFRTCMHYEDSFKVNVVTLNDARIVVLNDKHIVSRLGLAILNVPTMPQDVTAVNVKENQVTITWKSMKCEIDNFNVEIYLVINNAETKVPKAQHVRTVDMYYVYNYTVKGLPSYRDVTYRAYSKSDANFEKSELSPLKRVRTKPSRPDKESNLMNAQRERGGIRLTWKLPHASHLNGLPNETRIIGRDMNYTRVLYRGTFYREKQETAWFVVNETQRCAYYQVKFCNAPHLCSDYSKPLRVVGCGESSTEAPETVTDSSPSSTETVWIVSSVSIALAVIVIISAIVTYLYYQKKRRHLRPQLPVLEVEKNNSGNYIPVGKVSHPGEYDSLDKEECLDELIT